jgi:FkbM family methyltransferase
MTDPITREHIVWAYRVLLDREPGHDEVSSIMASHRTMEELRRAIASSEEYERRNPDVAEAGKRTLVIRELEGGVRLVIDLADQAIGLNILRGRFELNELDFVRRTVRPGQHVIDAGAHIGFFAMHMAALVGTAGSVQCFEPLEQNAACLEQAIRENGFERRVRLERAAVSAEVGIATLVAARGTSSTGLAYLQRRGEPAPVGHELHPVRMVALDDWPLRRPVSFIKIDVEGAEPLALRGAAKLLRQDHPVILCDLHPVLLERVSAMPPHEFIREMACAGYRCHLLGAGVHGREIDDAPGAGVAQVVFLPKAGGA